MSYVDRFVSGLKAMLASQVLYMASNAVLILLLTRYLLSPSEFGLLQFALSVLGVVVIFGNLGLPKSTARYVTEYAETDPTQIRYILRRSAQFVVGLSLAVGLVLAAGSGPLARALGEPQLAPLLVVGVGYVTFKAFSGFLSSVFQGFNRVTWSGALTAISGVARTSFAVAFALLGLGAFGVLLGYAVGVALAAVVGAVVLYLQFYRQYEPTAEPESGLTRRIIEYSVPLTASKGADVLNSRVDAILVGVLLNPLAVGFYVLSMQVAVFVTVPATAFGYTISPAFGEHKARDQVDVASRLYEEALTHVALLFIPAAVGLALVAHPLMSIVFGDEYLPAAPVLQVLGAFVLVHSVNTITSSSLDYLGQARDRAVAQMIMAVSNFALNLLLIPLLGVVGAAIATVVTYGAYTLTNVYYIHGELSLRVGVILRKVFVICLISGAMAAVVLVLVPYVSGFPTLLGVVLLGGVVWACLSVLSGVLDVERVLSVLA